MTDDAPKGNGSAISILLTVIGLIAARHPDWGRIVFLSQHTNEVTEVAGYVVALLGQVGLYLSHPPTWIREPWDDFRLWVASFFRRKPTV